MANRFNSDKVTLEVRAGPDSSYIFWLGFKGDNSCLAYIDMYIRFPADIRLRKEPGSLLHITPPTSIGAYVQNGRPH